MTPPLTFSGGAAVVKALMAHLLLGPKTTGVGRNWIWLIRSMDDQIHEVKKETPCILKYTFNFTFHQENLGLEDLGPCKTFWFWRKGSLWRTLPHPSNCSARRGGGVSFVIVPKISPGPPWKGNFTFY